MFSIKGKFKDNKLFLGEPLNIQAESDVILTFLDADDNAQPSFLQVEEENEQYYEKLRKHKRYPAQGSISLTVDDEEVVYKLRDYSAGGLSFTADRIFLPGTIVTASIKDPIEKEVSILDFEFEVARVVKLDDQYIVGCKFFDDVDEELWHSLVS
jgi:hypothetical protein